jgi:hydrogenase maturation protease
VRVANLARLDADATRAEALARALVSAHVVIRVAQGELVSLLDAPDGFRDVAASCSNTGVWPVLVGEEGSRDCMLASPIILYDYPQVAPESAGDLFDATEIDEILALRILTMTDEEKREVRESDDRARRILERTEGLSPEHWERLHGAVRGLRRLTGDSP